MHCYIDPPLRLFQMKSGPVFMAWIDVFLDKRATLKKYTRFETVTGEESEA